MGLTKSIIVVYDKPQKDNARLLCHLLSKKNGAVKASQISYEVYDANIAEQSSRMYYIFLGNKNSMDLVAAEVDNWIEEQGVRIGYDYHKGFIQLFDEPKNVEELNLQLKKASKGIIGWYALAAILFGMIGIALMTITRVIIKSQKKKSTIIKLQYALGSSLFVEKYLDGFLAN